MRHRATHELYDKLTNLLTYLLVRHCWLWCAGILVFAAMFGTLFHANSSLRRLIARRVSWTCWRYSKDEKSAQMRCKHRTLAVVRRSQKFRPVADPVPGDARDGHNYKSAGDGHYLHLQTQFGEDRCMHFLTDRGNRPIITHTCRQDSLQYTVLQLR